MAEKSSNLPKGWKCPCGTFNKFALWVYAHWDIEIKGTCTSCGNQQLFMGGKKI